MRAVLAALLALFVAAPAPAAAWGASGHEWVSGLAMEHLPAEIPAFLRTKAAIADIELLSREPDRWRGAGRTHDAERDPGHYIDLDDAGLVFGVTPLADLPETRADYDTGLRVKGYEQYRAGYLPYSIVDGWQQLVKDFGYWRVNRVGERSAKTSADRAWFKADRKLRERLILRDLGVWSHYVGDASQPHHTSLHFDGWGNYPNPKNYFTGKGFHSRFEGAFVKANLSRAQVAALMVPYKACDCPIWVRTKTYLAASHAELEPLFALEAQGAFPAPVQNPDLTYQRSAPADGPGAQFALARLAASANMLRDMILDAWRASDAISVGYPAVPVADVESGKIVPARTLYGVD